jgi:Spy/CpxP family protein refolding chaperone
VSRPRRIAVLVLAAVFLVGLGAGAVLEEAVDDLGSRAAHHDHKGDDHDPDHLTDEDADEELLAGLALTAEQHTRIEQLLEAREDRLESYWHAKLPELEALLDSTRSEIRNLLTPEQRAEYDRRLEHLKQRSRGEDHD